MGSLRQLDSSIAAKRKLSFLPWGLGHADFSNPSFKAMMDQVVSWGFFGFGVCCLPRCGANPTSL
ncbi:DNA ligase [Helicobacter bizzozeronii CCUG 35545]|nr:DNA ligase [Helicobacter bizzozeronii CCUG 35545]